MKLDRFKGSGILIGISGKARSGKDTFAEMLAEELYKTSKRHFVLMAYAQELKLRVQRDFDLRYEQLWGDEKEVEDTRYIKDDESCWTGREILQAYGQFFRSINKNFWVENLFNTIYEKEYSSVIITDIRHPNEADPINRLGGFVIQITSNREGIQDIHGKQHISETAMDNYKDFDLTVVNDGTLEDLTKSAVDAADFILKLKKMSTEVQNG